MVEIFKSGRWTSLFGRPMSFNEEIKRAIEVSAEIRLREIAGFEPEHSYVLIVFDNLPGRDEPLWATDDEWLYLRRPEAIWKTRLPFEHLNRIAMIYQTRDHGEKLYGGARLGRNFSHCDGWRRRDLKTEPSELDFPYGIDNEGFEIGPTLCKVLEHELGRLVVDAGAAFGESPIRWWASAGKLCAEGKDGRVVAFPIQQPLDFLSRAENKELWLRFTVWAAQWMEPVDAKVVLT